MISYDGQVDEKLTVDVANNLTIQTVLEGAAMPPRTKQLERKVKSGAIALLKKYLDIRVMPDEVISAHYRQPDDNTSMIIKVVQFSAEIAEGLVLA